MICRPTNVFLLLRHTRMHIGEYADLSYDCLHLVAGLGSLGDSRASPQAEDRTNGPGPPRHRLDQLSNRLTKILSETRKLNPAR